MKDETLSGNKQRKDLSGKGKKLCVQAQRPQTG
jgi:hypothetical protein